MATGEHILEVTDETFADEIEGADGLAIVDFWAAWCQPCRFIAPIIEQLAEEYGDQGLTVGKMDVDQNLSVPSRFGVRSIPSVLFFKGGEHVDTVVGAVPRAVLEGKVKQHLGVAGQARETA